MLTKRKHGRLRENVTFSFLSLSFYSKLLKGMKEEGSIVLSTAKKGRVF